jgi:hypothetical protein
MPAPKSTASSVTAPTTRSNGSTRTRQPPPINQPGTASATAGPNTTTMPQGFSHTVDPMDFETLPLSALRKYRIKNKLAIRSPLSLNGYLLDSSIGKKTISYRNRTRASKYEIASQVKKHFVNQPVRETETIVDFVYAIKRQGMYF